MSNVTIRNLVKRFDDVYAVNQVSVNIPEGSLTAMLGPSGCGKTTMLRCIAGLTMPDEGQIFIGEHDVTRVEPFKRNLGMVFQRPSMFPHMTAFENIAWGLRLRKWPRRDIANRVREMLALVHLEGMENRTFRQLSGGQAQRVVIARALAPAPDLLLLDEPLSALDAKLRDELKLEIAEIHRKTGATMILVTHDQGEALTIADNVLLMNDGKIEQEGTALDIYQNPHNLFCATFIGTNNFLKGTVLDVGERVQVGIDDLNMLFTTTSTLLDLYRGMPVWACIRADDIDILDDRDIHHRDNVAKVYVRRASLTGSIVIVEAELHDQVLRIHVGGGQRLRLLDAVGSTIHCAPSHIALVPRDGETAPIVPQDLPQPA